jgi:hypothetical protein
MALTRKMEFETSASLYEAAEELIKKGAYKNWQDFLETCVRNQLTLEVHGKRNVPLIEGRPVRMDFPMYKELGLNWDRESIKPISPLSANLLRSEYMPFCNRILPAKVASRVLCNVLDGMTSLELRIFQETLWAIAQDLGHYLSSLDEIAGRSLRLEALSTAFPHDQRKNDLATKQRFLSHFVGYIDSGGMANGMMLSLGLATINASGQIGITEIGHEFALLRNPILDDRDCTEKDLEPTLSKEEAEMYLRIVNQRLQKEAKAMERMRIILAKGSQSYRTICESFGSNFPESEGTQAQVSILLGRMRELMLVRVKQEGLKTHYELR